MSDNQPRSMLRLALLFWSLIIGLVIALIGLIAFGGFAKGKWY